MASFIFFIFDDFIVKVCLHEKISKNIIYLICLALPFISMSSAVNGYFVGVRRVSKNAIAKFFEEFIKITASFALLSMLVPPGIESACYALILGDVIAEILSFIYLYFLYIRDKSFSSSFACNFKDLDSYNKRILRISIPVALTSYLRSGLSTLKQSLVPFSLEKSGISCSEALSKYGLVCGMALPIIMLSTIFINCFANLLIPEFSRYYIKKDFKKIKNITFLTLAITTVLSAILALIFYVFASKICMAIYSNTEIINYVKILSPLIIFICLDIVIDSILKGLDAQVGVMAINIIDCITSIIFIYLVVPYFGINGFIFSIILSELINFSLSFMQLRKKLR
jgi:stage V sporulation protein B